MFLMGVLSRAVSTCTIGALVHRCIDARHSVERA